MVLVAIDRTWTFRLCSMYILHNTILVKSSTTEKNKEPLFLNDNIFQKNYHFKDFFWTGSGDGSIAEDLFGNDTGPPNPPIVQASPFEAWRTTTIFHTTTILFATVYPNVKGCAEYDCMPQITPVQTGSIDFSLTPFSPSHVPDIEPSSTIPQSTASTSSLDAFFGKNGNEDAIIRDGTPNHSLAPKTFTTEQILHTVPKSQKTEETNLITTTVFPETAFDQKYWLLTILKNDNYLPNIELNSTEKRLSTLYRQAFNRRQEKFLAGNEYGDGRERNVSQEVKAHIVNVTHIGNDIGIIYSITVAGNPVPAITAANDMRLMTASEVIAELGRPILTKAEPYIKVAVPLGARVKGKARDTWLLIGCVIAAAFLLILILGLFALILSKNQSKKKSRDAEEEGGKSNLGFDEEVDPKIENLEKQTQKSRFKSKESKPPHATTGNTVKFKEEERRESLTSSSCSGSSDAGLVKFRQMKKGRKREDVREKPKPKPRARGRKIQSCDCRNRNEHGRTCVLSAGSAFSKNTFDGSATEECSPRLTKSPTSYLSMPSVKAFPSGAKIPDPLNKILEPTSIRHLDADSDSSREYSRHIKHREVEVEVERVCEVKNKFEREKVMTRHASLEGDDPGFIGPIVWNKHCQKIFDRDAELSNEEYENVNVGKMRKRFNELLDDALSMFGSRNVSPEGNEMPPARQLDNRVHSAVLRPSAELNLEPTPACRPYTTGSKKPQTSGVSGAPKGAWKTPSSSTIGRPLSDDISREITPTIDKEMIFVNSELSPGDPAIPLIAAIKKELKKFEN